MGVPPPDPDPPPRSSVVPQFGSFALGSIPFQSSSLPVSDSARNGASPSFDSFVDKASLTGAQSVHLSDQGAAVQNQAPVSFQGVSSSSKLPVQDSSDSGLNPTGTVPKKRKGKSTVVDGNVVKPVGTPPPAQREGKQIMASTSENHVSSDRQAQLSDHAVDLTLLGTARGEFASPPKHSSDPASSSMAIDAVVSPPKHSSDPASSSMAIDAVVISKGSKSQFETSNSPVLDIVIANPHNSMVALLSSGSSSPSNRKKKKRKYGSLQSPVTRDILPLEWKNNHHLN
ncbi:hypothetical protein IGI04_026300 [Brassica rapa subsp. trilocularis]|uniref:AT-hook motif nuclear-localized protein n=1 Tax=Brassica rapa subsp. trilocularis TaxID=1813537 RepID=A0ABQ7KVL6_BRACM|nr:hypothetical protein IGI04_026300 [Brassica rapa subsp. trilocularis]